MKRIYLSWMGLAVLAVLGCGKVEEAVNEVQNENKLQGHWLLTETEHASQIERLVAKESIVLSFKDKKAAFSPTDSIKGQEVYGAIDECSRGPRPYKTDGNDLVFEAVTNCPEIRLKIQEISDNTLKLPDPKSPDKTRVFQKIDESNYNQLVKASDRKP